MAPIKPATKGLGGVPTLKVRPLVSTRSKSTLAVTNTKERVSKRKADMSPSKDVAVKRSAFGELTNETSKIKLIENKNKQALKSSFKIQPLKKYTVNTKVLQCVKTVQKSKIGAENIPPGAPQHPCNRSKVTTRGTVRNVVVPNQTLQKPKEPVKVNTVSTTKAKRLSDEFEKTAESLYSTALEEINESSADTSKPEAVIRPRPKTRASSASSDNFSDGQYHPSNVSLVAQQMEANLNLGNHDVPSDIKDFDKDNWEDIFQCSQYAMDIFNYLKEREEVFSIPDYMSRQVCLTTSMRVLLIDWMVEVQESFELNHETLYLGVKLVDTYLSKVTVGKDTLQLVGAAAMFIASKYDERIPPMIDDFLYICDGAYTRKELVRMEINMIKMCNFDLGIPISYRFLRRYARCARVTMPVLTLARYILELSLMDYATVVLRDSKLAAASLYMALKMSKNGGWNRTLEFYTGYKRNEFDLEIKVLNASLHKKPREQVSTVRNKYSHHIFFEVAKTPLMSNEEFLS